MRSIVQIRPNAASTSGIEVLDPRSFPEWNSIVLAYPNASVFHSVEWARVLLETYKWRPFYLRSAGGILPLIEVRSWVTGTRGICLPFSDFCSPLSPANGQSGLSAMARDLARAQGWKYLEVRGGIDVPGAEALASEQFYGHEIDLRSGVDAIFSSLDSSVRRAIRRAHNFDVTVTVDNDRSSLDAFWDLHVQTRRRHGTPPQPLAFMHKIHEHLLSRGMGFITVARHHGRAVAACVFLCFGKCALYKFGASDAGQQHLRGVNAAFWAGLKQCVEQGLDTLHMGRTDMDNPGLRRFKLGWGARETVIGYCRYNCTRNAFEGGQQKRNLGISRRIFRALPGPVLRIVGTALYRHAA